MRSCSAGARPSTLAGGIGVASCAPQQRRTATCEDGRSVPTIVTAAPAAERWRKSNSEGTWTCAQDCTTSCSCQPRAERSAAIGGWTTSLQRRLTRWLPRLRDLVVFRLPAPAQRDAWEQEEARAVSFPHYKLLSMQSESAMQPRLATKEGNAIR